VQHKNTPNILTKPLSPYKFVKFHEKIGIISSLTINGGCEEYLIMVMY
jgi:hypothetical protein